MVKLRSLAVAMSAFLLAGCPGERLFATDAAYLIAGASHSGISARAGGRLASGADIADEAFAIVSFSRVESVSDMLLLCRDLDGQRWWSVPKPPPRGVVLYEWIAEHKSPGGDIHWRASWLRQAMARLGVVWQGAEPPEDIETVLGSLLNGPKGTAIGDQVTAPQIRELQGSSGITEAEQWVVGMLAACAA